MRLAWPVLFLSCFGFAQFPTTHVAELNGSQVVPAVSADDLGLAHLSYNPLTGELFFNLYHSLADPLTAGLYGPAAPDENGDLIADLGDAGGIISGSVTLDAALEEDLYLGRLYIQLQSESHESGALRGRINGFQVLTCTMTGDQVVPPVAGNGALGGAVLSFDYRTDTLWYLIGHTVINAPNVGIYGPAPMGKAGELLYDLGPMLIVLGNAELTEQERVDLLNGLLYVQVNSASHPEGRLRGQIDPLIVMASALSGLSQSPPVLTPALGAAVYRYKRSTRRLTYAVYHNVANPTGAVLNAPGEIQFDLGDGTSPLTGAIQLNADQETALFNGELTAVIRSEAHPDGEISGAIRTVAEAATLLADLYDLIGGWNQASNCWGRVTVQDLVDLMEHGNPCATQNLTFQPIK